MSRQDDRRLRRVTGRAPIGASGRTGRAGPGEKVAKPRAPSLNGTLPAGYGKTRIVLLPVDPYLVHVYWEVSGSGMGFVKALVEEGALRPQAVLRFHDITAMPVGGVRAAGSFDVEVDIESRNWYVRLLSPEKSYVVDLGFRGRPGRFHRIARSNRGGTPRAWPCAEAGQQRMRVVEVDGLVHVDPVEEAEFEQDSRAVSEVSGHRPRIEIPQEDRRAVVGVAGAPVVTIEAGRIRETRPVHRSTESPGKQDLRATRTESGAETAERIRPIGAQDRRPSPLPNLRPVDASEEFRMKMEAVYERRQGFPPEEKGADGPRPPKGEEQGPAGADLSLLCDRLFVSGLSSSRIIANRKKDDRDDG
jgi:hypothetical protein